MSSETTTMNLLDCEASELAAHLLKHRFKDDALATASFLLECTSTLPNAEAISAQLMGEDVVVEEEETLTAADLGKAITKECTISMTTPRGKFQWTLHHGGIACVNAKGDKLVVPSNAVKRMVVFPKPQDCRKATSGNMVLLCFHNDCNVEWNGKPLTQACLQLPVDDDDWQQRLCTSLQLDVNKDVAIVEHAQQKNHSRYSFRSHDEGHTSTTTGGMPFVQCYHGVKDGVLYPLEEGLLFFKPPLFLHRSTLHSIACGRGTGGSRYVDMQLTLDDDSNLEFTNIHRDELGVLNTYIHSTLIPAMKKDACKEGVDDACKEDDVDPEETEVESESSLGKRKRTQRGSALAARQVTKSELNNDEEADEDSDEEDDEGWNEANAEEEESDSDDDEGEAGEPTGDNNDRMNVEEEFFDDPDSATESDE